MPNDTALWAATLGTTVGEAWLRRDEPKPPEAVARFREAAELLARGVPFAYAVGRVPFRRLDLAIDARHCDFRATAEQHLEQRKHQRRVHLEHGRPVIGLHAKRCDDRRRRQALRPNDSRAVRRHRLGSLHSLARGDEQPVCARDVRRRGTLTRGRWPLLPMAAALPAHPRRVRRHRPHLSRRLPGRVALACRLLRRSAGRRPGRSAGASEARPRARAGPDRGAPASGTRCDSVLKTASSRSTNPAARAHVQTSSITTSFSIAV